MNGSNLTLRGITWSHTRGYLPMVATAQRFQELHPSTEIVWEKRTLRAFEEFPIERLAAEYDLIVLDHPFVGYAAKHGPLLPLDQHLPASFLQDQAVNSVGASHATYDFQGHQWALAIDAATPVSFWRADLAETLKIAIPSTWDETLELAKRGHVEIPAAPINCLMNFYMLSVALGEEPFGRSERVVSREIGREVVRLLRELIEHCDVGCWERNPIASHDRVAAASNRRVVYCPLAYGYSNYARIGYSAHQLAFGPPPSWGKTPLRSTLGGTGLAVSALRPNTIAALTYAQFAASPEVQRTLYTHSGGQPGHRSAWLDPLNNRISGDYFARTLPALDRAYVRPRYAGYLEFQQDAGPWLHAALRGQAAVDDMLDRIDQRYRDSKDESTPLS